MKETPSLYTYFWGRVAWDGDCYLWIGPVDQGGYGVVTYKSYQYTAHRLAWRFMGRTIPSWLVLDHICRRRRCVNLNHLELVTPSTNAHRVRHKNGICSKPPCPSVYDPGKMIEDARFLERMGLPMKYYKSTDVIEVVKEE